MNKSELIALGIDEEVAKKIMAINGTDIENAKQKTIEKYQPELENLKNELKTKDQIIADANAQIEKFNGLDVEGIKKETETWRTKYSEIEANAAAEKEAYEKKLQEQQYDFKLNEYANGKKFTNEFVKKAYIAELKNQGFKLGEDGTLLGAEDYTKSFMEKNPGVFVVEEAPSNEPQLQISAPTGGGQANSNTGFNFGFTPVRNVKN